MRKHCELLELRLKLDEAITYGTKKDALIVAREGLEESRAHNFSGEMEYFQGQLDILKKNYVLAIDHLDTAIKINPLDGAAFNDKALCMVELGLIDEAISYFDKGIEAEPDYATIYHNKGWLLNNIGLHTEAVKYLSKALELEPGRAVTYDSLADAYFNLGKYVDSLKSYRNVLKFLKPGCCAKIKKEIEKKIIQLERK
ncbi:MAG: tetratricopeptide repeat protein [Candidatus Omnitrophica bacterium]|nr:tetratricopeptide repeat protein [Candidatus Omnitrophota bacterium]